MLKTSILYYRVTSYILSSFTIFIDFIILVLLFLLSFPILNLVHIVLLAFIMYTNLAITLITVIIWFSIRMFLKKNHCCRNFFVQNGKVKTHFSIREGYVCIETDNTEYPQLNTRSCNKLLYLSKLNLHSSSTYLILYLLLILCFFNYIFFR